MGCASSSPVLNGEGGVQSATGSMAEKAKTMTNDAMEAGEQALNGNCGNILFSTKSGANQTKEKVKLTKVL